MRIAIVTGASSGIGEGFCHALDSEGLDSIWMVARRADRMEALSDSLQTPCRIIESDLSESSGVDRLRQLIESDRPEISFVVNSAGFGRFGDSWEVPSYLTRDMISLNCSALVDVTCMCIPYMSAGSSIIEICSASAYLPLRSLNVYSATKAFVRSFCNGLRRELDGKGIRVLEVSPGWVSTDFIPGSGGDVVPPGVFRHTVTREEVVAQAMRDLQKGRKRSLCGWYDKVQVWMCTHFPSLATIIWERSLGS